MGKVRVAIIGVGNCASSFVQGLHYYRNAKENERVPGIMHVNLGGYHIRDVEIVAAIDIDKNKVGKDLSEAIVTWPNNTFVFAKVPEDRRHRAARHDPRRARQVPLEDHPEGARLHRGHRQAAQGHARRRGGELPAGGLRGGHQVVRRAGARGRLRVRQLHPGVHRARAVLAGALREARAAGDRRRHQVAGRRHHHAPRAVAAVRRARRAHRPHLPAQLRRQHRLPQHARARAAGVEEDLQDLGGDQHHPLPDRRGRHPRRPERLRPVAQGPQVVPHPHGGHDLRRRAAQPGDEARGVGLAQLRRRGDRRGALRQAGPRPRPQGRAGRARRPTSRSRRPGSSPTRSRTRYTEEFIRDPKSDALLKERLRKAGVAPARYVSGAGAKAAKTSKMVEAAKPAAKRAKPVARKAAAKPKARRTARVAAPGEEEAARSERSG